MSGRRPDPMKVDPNQLAENELRVLFAELRERLRNTEEELKRLKVKPVWRTFLRMSISVIVSLQMLVSGLLYTYAINKLTSKPPDNGAESIVLFAILIYVIAIVLQLINAGGN